MTFQETIDGVKTALKKAAESQGHEAPQVIAVSKQQPEERVREALASGHRLFGENRVQEAQGRWELLKAKYPDVKLHLIGPLQTNKVKDAVALFDVIQTVDREKLARALADEMKSQGRALPCLIQVNTGAEDQKSGVLSKDVSSLLKFCRDCDLNITGLMCIPPVDEPPAMHFALLKKLAAENNLKELSMGMSGDYERAAALGASYVRIGTALFGER